MTRPIGQPESYRREQERNREGGRHGSGRHHRSSHRSSTFKIILFLGAGLFLETAILIGLLIRSAETESQNRSLVQARTELESLRPQVEKLQADIAALTQSRLPDLSVLQLDKVLPLNKDYVESIVFTGSETGREKRYDFKIVTHNKTLTRLHPRVDIFLFDRAGIQVGVSHVGVQNDGTPTQTTLDYDEIRSFASTIELNDNVTPQYYRLKIWK